MVDPTILQRMSNTSATESRSDAQTIPPTRRLVNHLLGPRIEAVLTLKS
jgi:hypothetical protein